MKLQAKFQSALKEAEQFPVGDVRTGQTINFLASVNQDLAHYKEAESLYKRACELAEKIEGPHGRNLAVSLSNLATFYQDQAKFDESESLERRALKILETHFAEDKIGLAGAMQNLALTYRTEGRYADAETIYYSRP